MNEKQRAALLAAQPKRFPWLKVLLAVIFVGSIMGFLMLRQSQNQVQPLQSQEEERIAILDAQGRLLVAFTPSEFISLLGKLMESVDPAREENSYMTDLMREKLTLFQQQVSGGQIQLKVDYAYCQRRGESATNVMMATDYQWFTHGQTRVMSPCITIYAPRIFYLARIDYRLEPGQINDLFKNDFAIAIVHEMVHLEQPLDFFYRANNPQMLREEEVRAWVKVNMLAVRPLREKGVPVSLSLTDGDDALKRGGDDPESAEFRRFMGDGKSSSSLY